jgi:hypothetical protein
MRGLSSQHKSDPIEGRYVESMATIAILACWHGENNIISIPMHKNGNKLATSY